MKIAVGEVVASVEGEEDVLAVIDVLDDFGGAAAGAVNAPFDAPTKPRLTRIN